ncbi:putative 2-oxoglutarate-dependent dioxygenase [Diplonema papillatum]|nr:putative 2-oxoglutarate-dependent dioxygenase [Diplonema papillatum]|eukprot:gene12065-18641_t
MAGLAIPVVDLQDPDHVDAVRKACESTGFFYVVNHGLPEAAMASMWEHSAQFFNLPVPLKAKASARKDNNNRGWTPMREEWLSDDQKEGDSKEGFYLAREPQSSEEAEIPMMGPNTWPDEKDAGGFRQAMETYLQEASKVGMKVAESIARTLQGTDVASIMQTFERPVAVVRLLKYAPERSDVQAKKFAAGAHTDYGFITLLAVKNGKPGLQVRVGGEWHDVLPCAKAVDGETPFLVNIGDLLALYTGDRYASTLHRVVNDTGEERYSTPFFFDPAYPTVVTCLPPYREEGKEYPSVTWGDHIVARYQATHKSFV